MILDILLGVPLFIFIMLGLRDGVVRKLVACIMLIIGLYLGQMYMHPVGMFLVENAGIDPVHVPKYGFLTIFMSVAVVQGLLYKILTGGYKIGGLADRVGGLALGFIEGALFLSSLLFIFAISGSLERETVRDSRLYRPIVNIAPQILDFTSTVGLESFEKLKALGTQGSAEEEGSTAIKRQAIDSTAILEAKKQNDILNRARESGRKNNH